MRETKRQNNVGSKVGSKSVDHPKGTMKTIPIVDSVGNEMTTTMHAATTAVPNSIRDSQEELSQFDTKKWKKIINGNVEMI